MCTKVFGALLKAIGLGDVISLAGVEIKDVTGVDIGLSKDGLLLDNIVLPENGTNGLGVQFVTLLGMILVVSLAFRSHLSMVYPFRSSRLILLTSSPGFKKDFGGGVFVET